MASERLQRRIDSLLDEAEAAIADRDWALVQARCEAVLALQVDHPDAVAYAEAARRALAGEGGRGGLAGDGEPMVAPTSHPDSFVGGRYVIRRFLGEGGKKRVFLAHDEMLDRDVAFALIKTEGLDATGRERITREAQAMGRLGSHPHVVSIFDTGEHTAPDGTVAPYVVTELMGGGDVEGLLEQADGELSLVQSLRIAQDVARGLAFAHGKQVVHRDLKPGNVWLTEDGTAKIGDFGLAVSLNRSRLTQHGMMVGTVAYMPPEQALGGEVTPQADLYSLGAMLYEMVTGRPPFQGSDPTAIISQHINTPPVAPSWHTEHCPPELEALILRLLEKDPGKRSASAAEVLELLGRVDPEAKSASHSASANPLDRLARGVFVGREKELERLRSAFDDAFAGRGSVVMLVGEPGIGKTRAAQELETYARMRGAHVFWGRTHESSGMPAYWPWVQVGNAWGAAVDLMATGGQALNTGGSLASGISELVRLFPALRQLPGFVEPQPVAEPEAAQFRLFDAYATFMRAQSTARPWLVVLDDLHWADKPTLQLLQFVARELANMRVLIAGIYRDTDLVRTHPLSEALAELNREGGFLRLPLRGLTRDEVASYLRQRAVADPPREVVDRIYEETEGNPFFLSEVVNLMAEEGTLGKESLSDIALPEGVREALGRRLDRLSDEANELLQVCAIVGREFTYDTLTLLAERTDDELLKLIEESLGARVVEETEAAGRYRFTHALMQETLLGELSTTRRVRLHGQVGEALERRYGANADARAARLALHFSESATLTPAHAEKAARYARMAGEQAEAQFAWGEAVRHYENALRQAPFAGPDVDEAELLFALGRTQVMSVDYRAARRNLLTAVNQFAARGDARSAARATLVATEIPAPPQRDIPLIEAALDHLSSDEPELRGLLLARKALRTGWETLSPGDVGEIEGLGREFTHAGLLGDAATLRARLAIAEGDWRAAIELYERSAQFYDAHGAYHASGWATENASRYLLAVGDLARHVDLCRAGLEYCRSHSLRFVEHVMFRQLGRQSIERGDVEQARMHASSISITGMHMPSYYEDEALLTLYEVTGAPEPPSPPPIEMSGGLAHYRLQLHGIRARCFLTQGREAEARLELDAHLEAFHDYAAESAVQVGLFQASFGWPAIEAVGSDAILRRWWEHCALDTAPLWGLTGSTQRFRGVLAARLGRLDDAEALLRAAADLCEREQAPLELGRVYLAMADVMQLRGDPDRAREYLDRAGELFVRCGARRYLDQVLAKKEILKA